MSVGSIPLRDVLMRKKKQKADDRDMFGTPKNRSKTWDIKKSHDPKQDRKQSKLEIKKDNNSNGC